MCPFLRIARDHRKNESSTIDRRDETKQNHAYLVEKNRLLRDRINDLEATVEKKEERITELEEEIEQLKVDLAAVTGKQARELVNELLQQRKAIIIRR
ncbi:hypothetical protein [Natrinema gelatinilyticum]|uniref:hypothetical protein n=1 Tax=Natrinema gelatinilyticum TaxID=2961571 RepID=UPI0020C57EF6|nr:hypothetical protein [Natrinema gelatinilyticum]